MLNNVVVVVVANAKMFISLLLVLFTLNPSSPTPAPAALALKSPAMHTTAASDRELHEIIYLQCINCDSIVVEEMVDRIDPAFQFQMSDVFRCPTTSIRSADVKTSGKVDETFSEAYLSANVFKHIFQELKNKVGSRNFV